MSVVGSQSGHWEEVDPHDRQREIAVSGVGDCQDQCQWMLTKCECWLESCDERRVLEATF
jgi:hypothetical protein